MIFSISGFAFICVIFSVAGFAVIFPPWSKPFYIDCFRQNMELVETLSKPNYDSKELNFSSKYSQPFIVQFLACLWKQNLSYWRNPQYTAVRFFYTVVISLIFGTICWRFGSKRFLLVPLNHFVIIKFFRFQKLDALLETFFFFVHARLLGELFI